MKAEQIPKFWGNIGSPILKLMASTFSLLLEYSYETFFLYQTLNDQEQNISINPSAYSSRACGVYWWWFCVASCMNMTFIHLLNIQSASKLRWQAGLCLYKRFYSHFLWSSFMSVLVLSQKSRRSAWLGFSLGRDQLLHPVNTWHNLMHGTRVGFDDVPWISAPRFRHSSIKFKTINDLFE